MQGLTLGCIHYYSIIYNILSSKEFYQLKKEQKINMNKIDIKFIFCFWCCEINRVLSLPFFLFLLFCVPICAFGI